MPPLISTVILFEVHGRTEKHNIEINRKMLAEMAVNDKEAFAQLVEIAKGLIYKLLYKHEIDFAKEGMFRSLFKNKKMAKGIR